MNLYAVPTSHHHAASIPNRLRTTGTRISSPIASGYWGLVESFDDFFGDLLRGVSHILTHHPVRN